MKRIGSLQGKHIAALAADGFEMVELVVPGVAAAAATVGMWALRRASVGRGSAG